MSKPKSKRIPISRAEDFAKLTNMKQVIIFGWDGNETHIVTWGDSIEACQQAATGANHIKKMWDWPSDTIVESAAVAKLRARIAELENNLAEAKERAEPKADEVSEFSIVHVIEGTEFERGWGQRPDGYIAFQTEAEARQYIIDFDKRCNNLSYVPDDYTKYIYIGIKPCTALFRRMLDVSKKPSHFNNLKDLGV